MNLIPLQIYQLENHRFGIHDARLVIVSEFRAGQPQSLMFQFERPLKLTQSEAFVMLTNALPLVREVDGTFRDIITESRWNVSIVSRPGG